jgi:hypothetical protein
MRFLKQFSDSSLMSDARLDWQSNLTSVVYFLRRYNNMGYMMVLLDFGRRVPATVVQRRDVPSQRLLEMVFDHTSPARNGWIRQGLPRSPEPFHEQMGYRYLDIRPEHRQ